MRPSVKYQIMRDMTIVQEFEVKGFLEFYLPALSADNWLRIWCRYDESADWDLIAILKR